MPGKMEEGKGQPVALRVGTEAGERTAGTVGLELWADTQTPEGRCGGGDGQGPPKSLGFVAWPTPATGEAAFHLFAWSL